MLLNSCQKHKLQITISLKNIYHFSLHVQGEREYAGSVAGHVVLSIELSQSPVKNNGGKFHNVNIKKSFDSEKDTAGHSMSKTRYVYFLIMTAFLNALSNCVLLSIQTFSCMPYGISAYHLTAVLYNIANPVACFIILFRSAASCFVSTILSFLGSWQ